MTSEESKNGQPELGFAGLASMVTDIGEIVKTAQANTPKVESHPEPNLTREVEANSEHTQEPVKKFSVSTTEKWIIGGWALIVWLIFMWIGSQFGTKPKVPAPDTYSSSASTASSVSSPTESQSSEPYSIPSRSSEEKPPIGTNNTLETAQLRWCLAEDIRIAASSTRVNSYVESDVDRFNATIADYNSRCGKFRYLQSNLERAKSDIESYRTVIASEGAMRFSGNLSSSDTVPPHNINRVSPSINNLKSRSPDKTKSGYQSRGRNYSRG